MEQPSQEELFLKPEEVQEPQLPEEKKSVTETLTDEEWEELNQKGEDYHRTGNW